MGNKKNLMELINDLTNINHRCADYYENMLGVHNALNMELKAIFSIRANKSLHYSEKLTRLNISHSGDYPQYAIAPGKIYYEWDIAKKSCGGNGREGLLNSFEWCEAATLEAYKTALTSHSLNDYASRKVIMDQKHALQTSLGAIKRYRDFEKLFFLAKPNAAITPEIKQEAQWMKI